MPAGETHLQPLRADAIGAFRLLLHSRFSRESLSEHLATNPGLSWQISGAGQYVVGGFWRRRPDIAAILELTGGHERTALVQTVVDAARGLGCELIVLDFEPSGRERAFWQEHRFAPVDRIVEYARTGTRHGVAVPRAPIREYSARDADEVLALERRAFPWLWWNSKPEIFRYSESPEAELWVCDEDQRVVGYTGLTVRGGHGHLDRLAVDPEHRRRGLGSALLALSLERFAARGARQVTLTTQFDNLRAQPLYDRFGFRPTRHHHTIHGRWLGRERDRTP